MVLNDCIFLLQISGQWEYSFLRKNLRLILEERPPGSSKNKVFYLKVGFNVHYSPMCYQKMVCLFVLNIRNQCNALYLITCAVVFGPPYNSVHRYYCCHFIDEKTEAKPLSAFPKVLKEVTKKVVWLKSPDSSLLFPTIMLENHIGTGRLIPSTAVTPASFKGQADILLYG